MSGGKWGEAPDPSGLDFLLVAALICLAVLLSFPTLRDLALILRAREDSHGASVHIRAWSSWLRRLWLEVRNDPVLFKEK